MTRKALGRGLSALLREVESAPPDRERVSIALIDPNPYQPRRNFSDGSLRELAESIRKSGVVQPVLLRRVNDRYQLVVGERRWRAAQMAGLDAIPAVVRELDDQQTLELALTENMLREDLNPLEVAKAFEALHQNYNLSHEEIAARVGVNRTSVTNTLRLLHLPLPLQTMLANGDISYGHARALLGIDAEAEQVELAGLIRKRGLSVRQVEAMVGARGLKAKQKSANQPKVDPNMRAAVLELERTLGTRVRIIGSEKRGKIEIGYFSVEDLNRIYDLLTRR